jgi:hypothetical protein
VQRQKAAPAEQRDGLFVSADGAIPSIFDGLPSPQTPTPIADRGTGASGAGDKKFDSPSVLEHASKLLHDQEFGGEQLKPHEIQKALMILNRGGKSTNVDARIDQKTGHTVYDRGGRLFYPLYVPNVLRRGRRDQGEEEKRIETSVAKFCGITGTRIAPRMTPTDESRYGCLGRDLKR